MEFDFHVHFGEHGSVERLAQLLSESDRQVLEATFSRHQEYSSSGVPGPFPREVHLKLYDYSRDGLLQYELSIEVEELSFNEPIPAGIFRISREAANIVWDADVGKVVNRTP